ncbi:MAG TPA: hypothetical protein VFZ52_24670 [Chryseolinea sp.]
MTTLDKITKVGRYFLGIPMMVFGIQHFLYSDFVVQLVPAWMPWRLFWTYFAGVALFASGLGIVFHVLTRVTSTLLGLMISTWILILHIPRIFEFHSNSEFLNTFNALVFASGAFLLSVTESEKSFLEKFSHWGARVSPVFMAISFTVFGLELFIQQKLVFIVGAEYGDIPGELFWVYVSGIAFIAAATAIVLRYRVFMVSVIMGIYILFVTIMLYGPLVLEDIYQAHAWATFLKGVAMSGSSLTLASVTLEWQKVFGIPESIGMDRC